MKQKIVVDDVQHAACSALSKNRNTIMNNSRKLIAPAYSIYHCDFQNLLKQHRRGVVEGPYGNVNLILV